MTTQSEAKPVAFIGEHPDTGSAVAYLAPDGIPDEPHHVPLYRRPTVTEAEAREWYMKHIAGMYGADAPAAEYEFGFWLAALRWREGVGK